MGAEVIILANPYNYKFLKGLTHSAVLVSGNLEFTVGEVRVY